jgi:dipeptidyl aminopeptidase/acylaminoacyl peptidase
MRATRAISVGLVALCFACAGAAEKEGPRVYRDHVTPHWFAKNTKFWYQNELPGGVTENIVIDAATGAREKVEKTPVELDEGDLRAQLETHPSSRSEAETRIAFQNKRPRPIELFWIDFDGERKSYGRIEPGDRRELHTFEGHVWLVANESGESLGVFEATKNPAKAVIDESLPKAATKSAPERKRRRNGNGEETPSDRSPDGAWRALVKEHNVFIKSTKGDEEIQLSKDGEEGLSYGRLSWSPDSKRVIGFRIEPGERKEVYLVQSSPSEGGRAKLKTRPYALPGDKFSKYELSVFDVAARKQIKPEVDRFEHEWEPPRVHWWRDRKHFAYQQEDRGHQRFRVIDVDAATGAVRNLIDEHSKTFIWTTHIEMLNLSLVNWLPDGLIYASEQSGWRHLYFVDAAAGKMNAITSGEWVVRGIESIDETNRTVTFQAGGVFADQDPYFIHFGRANFDGSGLVWLTEGNGNHTVQFSPDRKYIIDTYSRVDAAPVNELRRVDDGKLVCKLEEGDIAELKASGWQAPEVFVAKGRDGKTDIWGIIVRPRDLDPQKKYPILEDIYAGPQGSYVPKSFSSQSRYESWGKLGFVVVKMDGMGTANRSKAFHDVCWHNLKDAGFEDRILWMKAAAKKYPYLDISRVGVYGTSAGGQNAAAAVLFHPEFYKAAVANCGCHDNRMDKASWNEQWMGYPVGPQYSECSNIDNAAKLKGALFLIVGELDTNVPPESTLRFVDALIKADKDFEFLEVPGADHGTRGPAFGYVQRRTQDFFVRHLLGKEIPNRNGDGT